MIWKTLIGEHYGSKSVGILENEREADRIVARLKDKIGLRSRQIRIIHPHETHYDRKLEPETQGIVHTAIRAHSILGLAGLVLGLLAWAIVFASGWPGVRCAPLLSAVALMFVSTAGGLMLGGLVTARPDHENVILHVRDAARQGKWSVVVHTDGAAQLAQTKRALGTATDHVWSSL